MLAKYCDVVIAFIPDNDNSKGIYHTINEAKKFKKKVVIIS